MRGSFPPGGQHSDFVSGKTSARIERSTKSNLGYVSRNASTTTDKSTLETLRKPGPGSFESGDRVFRRIVQNFTPSWFIIIMSTGVLSICLHQLPYNEDWLQIIPVSFFVLNIVLFALFTFVSCLRYIQYPQGISRVLHHPHQSLFVATIPVGLATLINMAVWVCAPVWGHGMAVLRRSYGGSMV